MNIEMAEQLLLEYKRRKQEYSKEYDRLENEESGLHDGMSNILKETIRKNMNLLDIFWEATTECANDRISFIHAHMEGPRNPDIINLLKHFINTSDVEIVLEDGVQFSADLRDESLCLCFDTPERAAKFFKAHNIVALDLSVVEKERDELQKEIAKYSRLMEYCDTMWRCTAIEGA